jgi:uncharacterized hydrophobic protein (TIGR00271 family)
MNEDVRSTVEPGFIHRRLKFPLLEREDRVALAERVDQSTPAGVDFIMMMTLASVLASLGLMQGATAVVIGAMLVAPLMGPLLGAGLAVVQGNLKLFRDASIAIGIGVGIGLVVSLIVGLVNPGYEPSLEIEARGNPDLLDLGIAFASGMVAAYAQGRPNLASTLAGVAIAAALIPPLAVVGVALTAGYPVIAGNAAILLVTNLVAITLGAGLIFRMLGVRAPKAEEEGPAWARRAVILLVMGAMLLTAPLFLNMLEEKQRGQDRPLSYPVSPVVRSAMKTYLEDHPEMQIITLARLSVEPERGIGVLLKSDTEIGPSFVEEVQTLVRRARGEMIPVEVHVLRSAEVKSLRPSDEGGEAGGPAEPPNGELP